MPVCAVHAPVPADHPAGLGHRPLGQAETQRRDGARARRRRGRRAPAVPLAARLRPRLRRGHRRAGGAAPASRSRSRTCTPGGPRRPRDAGLRPALGPGRARLRQHHARRLPRRDRAGRLPGAGPALRRPLRHVHLTDGIGQRQGRAPDPRARQPAGRRAARAPRRRATSAATSCSRSTPGAPATAPRREADLWRRWRSPGCTSPPPRRARRRGTPC